jgi:hypothetical protein
MCGGHLLNLNGKSGRSYFDLAGKSGINSRAFVY